MSQPDVSQAEVSQAELNDVMARARKEVDLKSELQIMKRKELDEL